MNDMDISELDIQKHPQINVTFMNHLQHSQHRFPWVSMDICYIYWFHIQDASKLTLTWSTIVGKTEE